MDGSGDEEPMSVDITDLRAFYASPLGGVTRRLVWRAIDRFWGPLTGLRLMGLGYAVPISRRCGPNASARSPSCRQARGW